MHRLEQVGSASLVSKIATLGRILRILVDGLDLISFPLPTKPIVQPVHPWQSYLSLPTTYDAIFDLDLLY